MNKLLIKSSIIFEGANTIDCIRQTCIGLKNSHNEDEVKSFLNSSLEYLKEDLPFNVISELFSTILFCFKQNRNLLSIFLGYLLQRIKKNTNYLILSSFIFSDLICAEPQFMLPEYETLVEELLSSIIDQIRKDEKKEIILFDHEIPNSFKNELIINLLLSSKLKEDVFLNFFPSLFTQHILSKYPKFDKILEKVSKSGIIRISKQTEASNLDIYKFIKSDVQCDIKPFSKEAITLIENAVIYIKSPSKKKIKGLKKEKILQFLAVIIVIIKNYKMQEKVKFSSNNLLELFIEGTKYLNNNNNKVLNESIDLIVSNYFYINSTLSIPLETIFKVFEILLEMIQNDKFFGNKMTLFYSIFDLFDKVKYFNIRQPICDFFEKQGELIITQIIKHVEEINKDNRFANNKFDLKYFNQKLIFRNSDDPNFLYQSIYFLLNSCTNFSKKAMILESGKINQLFNNFVISKKWSEVLIIAQFMQKNGYPQIIEPLKDNINTPLSVKISLFGFHFDNTISLQEIIKYALSDPAPEEHDNLFSLLFDNLSKNEILLNSYLTLLFTKYEEDSKYHISTFFSLFEKKFIKFSLPMISVCQKMFDYLYDDNVLVFKLDFFINEKVQTQQTDYLLSILYDEIKVNNQCYQAYYCLMNIASSFPTVFAADPIKVFSTVYPALNYLSLIFEKKKDDKHLPSIKAGYSALLFLTSTLHSAMVVDYYIIWLFDNIESFSDTQILFSFMILNMLNEIKTIKNFVFYYYIIKYNFLHTISELLDRKVPEGYFTILYKNNIYKFLSDTYQHFLNYDIYVYAYIDELLKLEHPIAYAFDNLCLFYPRINRQNMFIDANSPQMNKYIKNVLKERDYWLSSPKGNENIDLVDKSLLKSFINEMDMKSLIHFNPIFPQIDNPITLKMARYITMQKIWVFKYILYYITIPITEQMYKHLINVIEHMNEIKQNEKEETDSEKNVNIDTFKMTDYIKSPYSQDSLIKSLINELFLPTLNNRCVSILSEIFNAYAINNTALFSLLSIISDCFTEVYQKCIGYASPSLLKVMYDLIEILSKMVSIDGFKENFFEKCGDNLINIVLSPELRCDPILLWNLCKFLDNFTKLPIRVTQIIGFTILLDNEKVLSAGISLCSKFSDQELCDINTLILNIFDDELKNKKRQSIIMSMTTLTQNIIQLF